MDIESLLQEKIKQKELAKIAKSENRRVKITADEITDPTVLGRGAIASMINAAGDEKAIAPVAKAVKETVTQVKSGNLEELEEILVNQVYVLTRPSTLWRQIPVGVQKTLSAITHYAGS